MIPADTNARPGQPGNPIISLQLLRFIAAFAVTAFHAHLALVLSNPDHTASFADYAWRVGASGVHVFFVISGFVMVYTTHREGASIAPHTFLNRRFLRIYPIYWLMAGIYVLAHLGLGGAYELSTGEVFLSLLLFSSSSSAIIGPGWTLAYEVFFYVCFAIAMLWGAGRGLVLLSLFFLGAVVAGGVLPGLAEEYPIATNSLLLEFIGGCWLGYAHLKGLRGSVALGAVLVAASLCFFAGGVALGYDRVPSLVSWGIPSLLLVAGALWLEPSLTSRHLHRLATLGESSYFLYLAHILLIDLFIAAPIGLHGLSSSAATSAAPLLAIICLIVSHAGHRWVEVPLLHLVRGHSAALAAGLRARRARSVA